MLVPGLDDSIVRFGIFLSVLVVMLLAETALPRRKRRHARLARWCTNLGMGAVSLLIMRSLALLAVPIAAIAAAITAERAGIGLFAITALPAWVECVVAFVLLDLAIWFQHWASHKVPLLWRLHRVHHADPEFDATTALRFHPIEIALSMLFKIVIVMLLGAAPLAVLLFEIVLNATALFNHANLALPRWLDQPLRLIIVTPDMHRIHHSVHRREHDTNFGFNLPWWDRLLGTYTCEPADGHRDMTIGLPELQDERPKRLSWALLAPFQKSLNGK